jgi:hypothetical protein
VGEEEEASEEGRFRGYSDRRGGRASGAECCNGGDVRDSYPPLAAATLWVDMAYVDHTIFLCSIHLYSNVALLAQYKGYIFPSNLHY